MNAMVRGSVEDPLQRTKTINHLSVDPKLIEKIKLPVDNVGRGRDHQRHRQVEKLEYKNHRNNFHKHNNIDIGLAHP